MSKINLSKYTEYLRSQAQVLKISEKSFIEQLCEQLHFAECDE